jgi:hypothetical protein
MRASAIPGDWIWDLGMSHLYLKISWKLDVDLGIGARDAGTAVGVDSSVLVSGEEKRRVKFCQNGTIRSLEGGTKTGDCNIMGSFSRDCEDHSNKHADLHSSSVNSTSKLIAYSGMPFNFFFNEGYKSSFYNLDNLTGREKHTVQV